MELLNYHDVVTLATGEKVSTIEIIRVGKIHGRDLVITESMLDEFIKNFENNTYRTEIQVNLGHNREGEAAGWIKKLFKQDGTLLAQVEWTPLGVEKVMSKQFRYTSSELAPTYVDPTTGSQAKNVLIGVALTNIPQVKGMSPVTLSEQFSGSKSFFNIISMKDNAKQLYSSLMKKEKISKEEMAECLAAAEKEEMPTEEMATMKKSLAKKCTSLSEETKEETTEEKEEEKQEEEKKEELSEKISLTEFNKYKKLAEEQQKANIALQERLDRQDLKEEVQKELLLSEENKIGFVGDEALAEVVDFMFGLSASKRQAFKTLIGKVKAVDLSVIGSTDAVKSTREEEVNKLLSTAQENAEKISAETGRDLSDCLSEQYKKLGLV